ncbi:MAG TPA: DUF4245 domain-containing protein [Candidatus Nesterenkonia stercoripullorum]|uniref:DUF4245 domain-containing protein n=1 Tax=Candidatus Nesterenkonia stercoripullorum TaxID=2838701 RepID=A0A9D1UT72_9MICC|nr:DUF4245 domain-containing protein [Candidatus Nesterenkonia stercoripullorum]
MTRPESPENEPSAQPPQQDSQQPTPQLTQSQVKRLKQPMIAMLFTVLLTAGAVAAFMAMNPEPDTTYERDEDVAEAARGAAEVAGYAPIAPDLTEEWTANYARWEVRPEQGVPVWEAGYVTPSDTFIGFAQTDEANPTWLTAETDGAPSSGAVEVDDVEFEARETEDRQYYILDAEQNPVDDTTVVVSGDASEEDFTFALEEVLDALGEDPRDGSAAEGTEDSAGDGTSAGQQPSADTRV